MSLDFLSISSKQSYAYSRRLSELLYLPMPTLKATAAKSDSIQIGTNNPFLDNGDLGPEEGDEMGGGPGGSRRGKWEDEEERRFFEDVPDLKDYVPRGVLGIEEDSPLDSEKKGIFDTDEDKERQEKERREREIVEEEVRKLDEELAGLGKDGDVNGGQSTEDRDVSRDGAEQGANDDEDT